MSASEPQPTYETAVARIEEIIRRLDSGDAGLRETLDARQGGPGARRVLRRRARGGQPRPRGAPPGRPRRPPRRRRSPGMSDLREARRPAARGGRLHARGAAGGGLERLRAPDHGRAPDRRRTRGCRRGRRLPGRGSRRPPAGRPGPRPGPVRAFHAGRVLRAGRLARPVSGGARVGGVASVPPAGPSTAPRSTSRCAQAGQPLHAALGREARPAHVRRLAAPRRAGHARSARAPPRYATRRCASSSTRRARGPRS